MNEREEGTNKKGKIYYERGRKRERRGERNEAATVTTVVAVFAKLPGSLGYTFKRTRRAGKSEGGRDAT